MGWVALYDRSPAQVDVELQKARGITLGHLVADGFDDPKLRPVLLGLWKDSTHREDAVCRAVLEHYGDRGARQPKNRIDPLGRTPEWGHLPPLKGGDATSVEPDLTGRPLSAAGTLAALRLYAGGASIQLVAKKTELSFRGARRVETWVSSGAVWWNPPRRVAVAPGFKLERGGSTEEPTLRLVRVDPF